MAMIYILGSFVFVLGTIVGSFLNVVSLRYNTGLSPLKGRSKCFSCGKELSPGELVPIFSFLIQRGKCKTCGSRFSWQYPIVEMVTGVLFLLTFLQQTYNLKLITHNFSGIISPDFMLYVIRYTFPLLLYWIIWSILIVITIYDLKHKIIPNGLVYAFALLGLLHQLAIMFFNQSFVWWGLAAGPLLFTPFFLLWFFSGGRWIGLGDGKLALGIGFFLGLSSGISAIILAFWIGAVVSLFLLLLQQMERKGIFRSALPIFSSCLTMRSEIPFGPFLILGMAVVFFLDVTILTFL